MPRQATGGAAARLKLGHGAKAATLASGSCTMGSGTGDYTGAQTDPNDLISFWLGGESLAPSSGGYCQWATTIVNVTP